MEASERRRHQRFNVKLDLEYAVLPRSTPPIRGVGTTTNISSSGLSFGCKDEAIQVGAPVIMDVMWPKPSAESEPIRLWVSGFVVRVIPPSVAVSISTHHFKREDPKQVPPTGFRDPGSRPLVIVIDTKDVYRVVTTTLSPYKYVVLVAEPGVAKNLLKAEQSTVGLLVTNHVEEVELYRGRVPIVYTGEAPLQCSSVDVLVVPKPMKHRKLRLALASALLKMGEPHPVD